MLHNNMDNFFPWLIKKDNKKENKNAELVLPLYEQIPIYIPEKTNIQEDNSSIVIIEIL